MIDRKETAYALAKACAYAQVNKPVEAQAWAARLMAALGMGYMLLPQYRETATQGGAA